MPKCIQCNETYGDHLRRCPHCGEAPEGVESQEPVSSAAEMARRSRPGRVSIGGMDKLRLFTYLAVVLVLAGAGIVFYGLPGAAEEDEREGAPLARTPVSSPRRKPDNVQQEPLENSVSIDHARLEEGRIVVRGHCSPKVVVRVQVQGQPAFLAARGDQFIARIEPGVDEVEVVAEDVEGTRFVVRAQVQIPGGEHAVPSGPRVTNFAQAQTVHLPRVRLEFAGGKEDFEANLRALENRVLVGNSVLTIYRAPRGLVFLRATKSGHYAFLRELDGQEMVLLPGGLAKRGMGEEPPNGPQHVVRLSAHLMDRTEVTCGQYADFLERLIQLDDPSLRHPDDPGVEFRPANWLSIRCPEGSKDLPVTGVSWYAAYTYARWVKGRLPTEAEWERGAAGPRGHAYPWGDEFDPALCARTRLVAASSRPAGASYFDLLHMAGNAREWCEDRYGPRWYLRGGRTNPRGPSRNKHRVVRGGSFMTEKPTLRTQFRDHVDPRERPLDVGFRVVIRWIPFSRPGE